MSADRDTEPTPMLFRVWRDSLIALMPYEPADTDPRTCMSYQTIGQHGAADPLGIVQDSRPATPAEREPLLTELHSMGYLPDPLEHLPADAPAERRRRLEARE